MTAKTYIARTCRDGKHLAHLDRTFATLDDALLPDAKRVWK